MEHKLDFEEDESPDSFENFLKDKEKQWTTSPSQMRTIPTPQPENTPPTAPTVAVNSEEKSSSTTDDVDEFGFPTSVPDVGVASGIKGVTVEIREKPIIGLPGKTEIYTVETDVDIPVDEEWRQNFSEICALAKDFPVTRASVEQVIERTHKIVRAIFLDNAKLHGLHHLKAYLLERLSEKDRAELLKLDQQFRVKQNKRAATSIKERKERSSSPTKASSSAGKTKAMKTADTLKTQLAMSKDGTIERLKTLSLYDEPTKAYVEKIYGDK
jgi:hypothetical protein